MKIIIHAEKHVEVDRKLDDLARYLFLREQKLKMLQQAGFEFCIDVVQGQIADQYTIVLAQKVDE